MFWRKKPKISKIEEVLIAFFAGQDKLDTEIIDCLGTMAIAYQQLSERVKALENPKPAEGFDGL